MTVQLAGVNAFPQWILGFGVASALILGGRALRGSREALLFLLPSVIALFFTLEVSLFLDVISTYPPMTYDAAAYVADFAFVGPVSFRVGQLFAAWPLLGVTCTAIYLAPPPGLIFVYALQVKSNDAPRVDIVTSLVAMGAVGYALYFLVPACGPKFLFPSFPHDAPDPAPLIGTLLPGPHAPRNAIPSLHMASRSSHSSTRAGTAASLCSPPRACSSPGSGCCASTTACSSNSRGRRGR